MTRPATARGPSQRRPARLLSRGMHPGRRGQRRPARARTAAAAAGHRTGPPTGLGTAHRDSPAVVLGQPRREDGRRYGRSWRERLYGFHLYRHLRGADVRVRAGRLSAPPWRSRQADQLARRLVELGRAHVVNDGHRVRHLVSRRNMDDQQLRQVCRGPARGWVRGAAPAADAARYDSAAQLADLLELAALPAHLAAKLQDLVDEPAAPDDTGNRRPPPTLLALTDAVLTAAPPPAGQGSTTPA